MTIAPSNFLLSNDVTQEAKVFLGCQIFFKHHGCFELPHGECPPDIVTGAARSPGRTTLARCSVTGALQSTDTASTWHADGHATLKCQWLAHPEMCEIFVQHVLPGLPLQDLGAFCLTAKASRALLLDLPAEEWGLPPAPGTNESTMSSMSSSKPVCCRQHSAIACFAS